MKESNCTGIGGDQQVEIAVVIYIGVSGSAAHARRAECRPHLPSHLLELPLAKIAEQMRRLAVLDTLLDFLDVILYMSIGDEDVGATVQVIIKEEAGEAQREQAGVADFGTRRLIYKQAIALIVIERHHLVGEIRNDDAGTSRPVIVSGIHAHARTRNAIFPEGDPCLHTLFRKG